jgi:hypothetical protein
MRLDEERGEREGRRETRAAKERNGTLEVSRSEAERAELVQAVKRSPQPYLRARAAAIMTVAAGESASRAATEGLLRRRISLADALCGP